MTEPTCRAETTILDGPHLGITVRCSGKHHSPDHHDGPVPGTSGHSGHPLRYAWPRPKTADPPTDHRAEAEKWLRNAAHEDVDWDGTAAGALLAIAHDLHRFVDALEQWPDDQPGPGNVEADYGASGPSKYTHGYYAESIDPEDHRPHSATCLNIRHAHGPRCGYDCPTCGHTPVTDNGVAT